MKSLRIFFVLVLAMLIGSAQATLITSLEGGNTLADNGLTLTQGITSRATIQSSVTSIGVTLIPTESTHLFKMIAGTDADIINPASPNDLTTLVSFNNPITIDKKYLLMDIAFLNRDVSPFNDRQRLGINGVIYDITGSMEAGYQAPFFTDWQTLAIDFTHHGLINLSLGCVNDKRNGGSSYCLWDNFRTADTIPTLAGNNGIPIFSSPNIPTINLAPPVSPVPEPGTWAMMLLGLIGISAFRRGGKILLPLTVEGLLN